MYTFSFHIIFLYHLCREGISFEIGPIYQQSSLQKTTVHECFSLCCPCLGQYKVMEPGVQNVIKKLYGNNYTQERKLWKLYFLVFFFMATASTNTLLARTLFIGGGELLYNLAPVDPVAGVLEAVLGQSEAIRVLCHFGIQRRFLQGRFMESNI